MRVGTSLSLGPGWGGPRRGGQWEPHPSYARRPAIVPALVRGYGMTVDTRTWVRKQRGRRQLPRTGSPPAEGNRVGSESSFCSVWLKKSRDLGLKNCLKSEGRAYVSPPFGQTGRSPRPLLPSDGKTLLVTGHVICFLSPASTPLPPAVTKETFCPSAKWHLMKNANTGSVHQCRLHSPLPSRALWTPCPLEPFLN